jgi:hypothetical protein
MSHFLTIPLQQKPFQTQFVISCHILLIKSYYLL